MSRATKYFSIIILLLPMSLVAHALDTIHNFSIAEVLESDTAKNKLVDFKFYFGDQNPGKIVKTFGTVSTNQKTNSFAKSDQAACEWVFISALIELKNRAFEMGGNAVINIKSNYKDNLTSSNTTFQCGAGAILAGVALQGKVVTLE